MLKRVDRNIRQREDQYNTCLIQTVECRTIGFSGHFFFNPSNVIFQQRLLNQKKYLLEHLIYKFNYEKHREKLQKIIENIDKMEDLTEKVLYFEDQPDKKATFTSWLHDKIGNILFV